MNLRCPTKPSRPVFLQPDFAMRADSDGLTAAEIAKAVTSRKMSALQATEAALARIKQHDTILNSFTDLSADRARARARAVDAAIAAGKSVGPLAGVPFAVKNLFDVEGLATRAGSKINRDLKPSLRDATLIERMEAAGAVLVGALNMGEYAYRRKPARWSVAQPARSDPDERRFVRRLRQRGRRRPGADRAGVGYQRLDPGAGLVLWHIWIEADLWPAVACKVVSLCREPRSSGSARAFRLRSRACL
jgi:hypothetical protein